MAYSYQGTLSVSDDGSSGLVGELNYGVQSLSPVSTSDYNTLTNKPRINNIELVGNVTTEQLGLRNGEDGFSPVITERETELGYDITITDVEGSNTITLKNGTNGLNGTNGQDGKSAYEIAVDNGFVGTETEWLESLKGQDGQDGIVMDAPSDGKLYGRMNANWVEVTGSGGGGGIPEAPADSKAYARKDNAWVETVEAVNVYTKTEANEAFLPKTTVIPTKTSELTNDSGFITSIPEEYVTNTEMTAYAQPKGDYALKTDIPTTLPANGGNADTLDGLHASDIQIDEISDTAGIVTLDRLQGGVPFSEVVLSGDIVGQEVTLAVSGKNMLPKPNWENSIKTSNGVTFSVGENGTITISGTTTGNATVHLISSHINVTEPLTLSSNGTLSGISLIFRLVKDGGIVYRTVYNKSVIESGVVIEDIYLQQQKTGVEVSGEISPQLEIGSEATEYEPYSGSMVTITPDSNPYIVPNDIRQQDGLNNVSVSAGEVSVTGVKRNAAVKKIWDNCATTAYVDGKIGNIDTILDTINGEVV